MSTYEAEAAANSGGWNGPFSFGGRTFMANPSGGATLTFAVTVSVGMQASIAATVNGNPGSQLSASVDGGAPSSISCDNGGTWTSIDTGAVVPSGSHTVVLTGITGGGFSLDFITLTESPVPALSPDVNALHETLHLIAVPGSVPGESSAARPKPTELVWVYDYAGAQTMALHELLALELDDRLQQSETLRFTIAAEDPKADFVLIDTKARYRDRVYRIKRRVPSREGTRTTIDVEAEALWVDLGDRVIPGHFLLTDDTPDHGLDLIVLHRDYGWTVGDVDAPAFAFYGIDKTDATILELLREWAHNTGCELIFDTAARTVSLVLAQGESRDLGFRYAWNLRGITRRETPPEVTRLYAYGRNGLTIKALSPDGTEHIDDFSYYIAQGLTAEEAEAQYLREKIWKDDAFISDAPLYEAAVARLADLAQPVAAYEAKVIDLTGSGYPVEAGIGDTVPVRDTTLGISIRTRVVRLVTRPLAPHDNEIELAYLQSRPSDSSSTRSDSNGEDWLLFLNNNLADRTIDENLAILNDIGLQFSGEGQALFHLDAMGVATGAGAVRVQFWDETTNELAGATDDFLFADEEPVHISVTFGLEGLAGQHLFSVRIQVVDGTGSIAFETGSSRFAILANGALGVSLPPDDNSVTFDYIDTGAGVDGVNGEVQTFEVPPDVTSIVVDCYGAEGSGGTGHGGKGGRVRARIPVIAGETLDVNVGGHAATTNQGGWNGGGNGGFGWTAGGPNGGGGASDVRRGSTLADRLIIAGGGGGEGGNSSLGSGGKGGDGGYPDGEPGRNYFLDAYAGDAGGGGTQTAGGAGGTGSGGATPDGTAGTLGQGGDGGASGGFALGVAAGGGGGGLYGGGGAESNTAGAVAGGGGGSGGLPDQDPLIDDRPSTATEVFVEDGVRSGHGQVIISWDTP